MVWNHCSFTILVVKIHMRGSQYRVSIKIAASTFRQLPWEQSKRYWKLRGSRFYFWKLGLSLRWPNPLKHLLVGCCECQYAAAQEQSLLQAIHDSSCVDFHKNLNYCQRTSFQYWRSRGILKAVKNACPHHSYCSIVRKISWSQLIKPANRIPSHPTNAELQHFCSSSGIIARVFTALRRSNECAVSSSQNCK